VTSDPDFKVTIFFEVDYPKKQRFLKTNLLLHKRKSAIVSVATAAA